MKKKLSIIEKVAMTWTFPITLIAFAFLSVMAIFLFLFASFLNVSGTIGAAIYLFEQTKLMIVGRKLNKLIKKDEKMYKFGSEKTEQE
jgi:hypothetical protein